MMLPARTAKRRVPPALLAAVLAVPLAAGPVNGEPALAAGARNTIAWGPCPAPPEGVPDGGMQCGTVTVPVDYADAQSPDMNIAVSRISAASPSKRRGVLLLNPGGPGGSGLDLPQLLGPLMSSGIRDRYDLIGFDPRGVGLSEAITCGITDRMLERSIPWPLPGGVTENAALAADTAAECAANAGPTLPHITTANTARDMDRIRIALGERKISYLGYSYGSYLGAAYASLFPTKTDRFVIDSVVGPSKVWRNVFRDWGPAVEDRFPDLTSWVAARHATYGLGATSNAVRARYFLMAFALDRSPLALPEGALPPGYGDLLTGNVFRELTRGSLYLDAYFPVIADVWKAVNGGLIDAISSSLAAIYQLMFEAAPDNSTAALFGVVCGDAEWPRDISKYKVDVLLDSLRYPVAGAMAANVWPCVAWPQPPREPQVTINDRGPRNILIMQNRRDPATPYWQAQDMREKLGGRARMVIAEQGGHTAYLLTQNTCVDDYVTAFLVSGRLPSQDTTCAAPTGAAAAKSTGVNVAANKLVRIWLSR